MLSTSDKLKIIKMWSMEFGIKYAEHDRYVGVVSMNQGNGSGFVWHTEPCMDIDETVDAAYTMTANMILVKIKNIEDS